MSKTGEQKREQHEEQRKKKLPVMKLEQNNTRELARNKMEHSKLVDMVKKDIEL